MTSPPLTRVERKLLLCFSGVGIPDNCGLRGKTQQQRTLQRDRTNTEIWAVVNQQANANLCTTGMQNTFYWVCVCVRVCVCTTVTLSTPALRIKFPFLFHLSANIGPLCWPKVLARFPSEGEEEDVERCNTSPDRQNEWINLTIFCPYSGEAVVRACCKQCSLALKEMFFHFKVMSSHSLTLLE